MLTPEIAVALVERDLGRALATGTYSRGFRDELALHVEHGTFNVGSILDEIAILEGIRPGPSQTKEAAPFKGRYLLGFWHKHHAQTRFLPQNARLEVNRDKTVERVLRRHVGKEVTAETLSSELAHAVVWEKLTTRGAQGRMTGEWIVFAKTQVGHRYLTLACHDEGDEQVMDRITTYQALNAQPETTDGLR